MCSGEGVPICWSGEGACMYVKIFRLPGADILKEHQQYKEIVPQI
jgi:hypothetical protein